MTDDFCLLINIAMKKLLVDDVKCFKCENPAIAIIRFVIPDMPVCADHLKEQSEVWCETHRIFSKTTGGFPE